MLYLLCLCRDIKLKKACLSDMQSLFFYCKDIYIYFFYYIIITVLIETIRFPPYIGKFNFVIHVTFDEFTVAPFQETRRYRLSNSQQILKH